MERVNRRVGLPLFQMEDGIVVTNPFLVDVRLNFQVIFLLMLFGFSPVGETGEGFWA